MSSNNICKFNLENLNNYFEKQGVKLSDNDKKQIKTIFEECDIYNGQANSSGKDGMLNLLERLNFTKQITKLLPHLKEQIQNFGNELIHGKKQPDLKPKAHVERNDATYVAPPNVDIIDTPLATQRKNLPEKISKTTDIRSQYDWSEEEFNKVLSEMLDAPKYRGKFKNSVLHNQGKAFIEAGKKYNIDPRILVSIAMCESGRGISPNARNLNNVGGIVINGKTHHFESVADSIQSIAKTVDTRYKEGYTTLEKIGMSGRYCKKSAAPSWIRDGSFYLSTFDKYYKE